MASNPYSKYGSLEEYNIRGDRANGRQGSYSSGAISNRAVQQTGQKSANPYAEILNYLPGAQQAQQPVAGMKMAGASVGWSDGGASPYVDPNLSGPGKEGSYTVEQLYGTYGPNGEYIPPSTTTVAQGPPGGGKTFNNDIDNPLVPGDPGGGGSVTTPPGGGAPPPGGEPVTPLPGPQLPKPTGGGGEYTASNGQKYPIPPPPQGVDPALWEDVTGYVTEAGLQGQDYSWLWTYPNAVQEFRAWGIANPARAQYVDIADWLKHNYGAAQGITATHGLAGRRGYDTMVWSPAGVPWGHGLDGTGGQGINPTGPPQGPPPGSGDANGVPLPPGYSPPSDPNGTGRDGGPGTQPAPPGTPGAPPPTTLGPVIPREEIHNPNAAPPIPKEEEEPKFIAGGGPNGGPDWKTPEMTPDWAEKFNPQGKDLFDRYGELLDPMYQREQDKFARKLRAQGALTGQIDSGGFGTQMAEGLGGLAAAQSADKAGKITAAHESALDRALQKYGIDTGANTQMYQIDSQKFIAQLQDDTARLGIKTNADLERYLGDRKLELEKYGIDTNDMLERYKAEVAKQVGMYSADRGVDAAALQASAAGAAASASAAAAQYDAQVRLQLGQQNLQWDRERYGRDREWDQYQFNNPDFNTIMNWYLRMSPEQLAINGLGGGFQWPDWVNTKQRP